MAYTLIHFVNKLIKFIDILNASNYLCIVYINYAMIFDVLSTVRSIAVPNIFFSTKAPQGRCLSLFMTSYRHSRFLNIYTSKLHNRPAIKEQACLVLCAYFKI